MTTRLELKIDWLALFLLLVPTFYVLGMELREVQGSFFQIAVFALIALIHCNRYIRCFLLIVLFQYLSFPNLPVSFYQVQGLFLGALAYHLIIRHVDFNKFKFYLWIMLGFLIFNCFWSVLQAWNVDPIFVIGNSDKQPDGFREYIGFFGLPAMFGNYGAVLLPISFALMPVSAGFCFLSLWLAKSTFSIIAAVAGAAFFLWFRKRILFWICTVAGIGVSIVYIFLTDMPSGQFGRRFDAWHKILIESFKKQWMGHGLGSLSQKYCFSEITPTHKIRMTNTEPEMIGFIQEQAVLKDNQGVLKFISTIDPNKLDKSIVRPGMGKMLSDNLQNFSMDLHVWKEAHNEFIQVFFELGIFALIAVVGYIVNLFRRFYLYGRKSPLCVTMGASFLALVIVSFGHFPFHVARLATPFLVIAAFFDLGLLNAEGKTHRD